MPTQNDRRAFLAATGAAAFSLPFLANGQPSDTRRRFEQAQQRNNNLAAGAGPVVIASGNGLETVRLAQQLIAQGGDPLDAIVAGVKIVEDDPNDMSVGYGGLPNEEGVVELDSSVMHGPMHRSGAVAALRNIKNPAAVAREVARRTDHCMIVGEGALKFAKRMGFKEENLLTERAREAWLRWRSTLNRDDDWLQNDELDLPVKDNRGANSAPARQADPNRARQEAVSELARESTLQRTGNCITPYPGVDEIINGVPYTTGTIHCSALTAPGADLAGCTTTSGLSWKLPGRVGDSPIIGAGLYTDNEVGSAGATGRGEAVIQICGAHTIVMRMEAGDHPRDACLYALQKIADCTRVQRLLDEQGRPNFNVVFYAVRKDGQFGSACMRGTREFAIADSTGVRLEKCATLFDD